MTDNIARALLDPAVYPWNPPSVEVIETHISWVFLAGDLVVKVKRPVDLKFVDFTLLERRHFYCDEEVRLNRRLTTDVYLGVVPVVQGSTGYRVDGDGEPVEWATLMRRLPADDMLDTLLRANASPDNLADLLVVRLLPFHQGIPGTAVCSETVSDYMAIVTDNLDQLEGFAANPLAPFQLSLVSVALNRFIKEEAVLLRRRVPQWIREGHGDLRAEHICLESGKAVQIFDCVEFNRDIRCADIASELAFLFMDLNRLGASTLACELLDRYRAAGFDLPDALIRFYTAHRALVRAKVACWGMQGVPADMSRKRSAEAADYLNLATAAVVFARPMLIVVSGLSGSGKSTVAAALSRALAAPVHSSDQIRKELAGIDPLTSAASEWRTGIYAPEWTARTYDFLRERALAEVEQGRTAIIDATLLDGDERSRLISASSIAHVPLVVVESVCDEEVLLRRMRARATQSGVASDATEAIYRRQRSEFERAWPFLSAGALSVTVDTTVDGPVNLDLVLKELSTAGLLTASPSRSVD